MSWFDYDNQDQDEYSPRFTDYGDSVDNIDPLVPDIHSDEEHEEYGDFDPELKGY